MFIVQVKSNQLQFIEHEFDGGWFTAQVNPKPRIENTMEQLQDSRHTFFTDTQQQADSCAKWLATKYSGEEVVIGEISVSYAAVKPEVVKKIYNDKGALPF